MEWIHTVTTLMLALVLGRLILSALAARRARRMQPTVLRDPFAPVPTVGVVIAVRNNQASIGACLDGLARQTHPLVSVVIVDESSTDRTAEALERAITKHRSRMRVEVARVPAYGRALAMNLGLLMTGAEIVVAVAPDAVLADDAIECLVESFLKPEVGLAAGVTKVARGRGWLSAQQALDSTVDHELMGTAFGRSAAGPLLGLVAFRRSAVRSVGGYSSDWLADDVSFLLALQETGFRVVTDPRAVAWLRSAPTPWAVAARRYRRIQGALELEGSCGGWRARRRATRAGLMANPISVATPIFDAVACATALASVGLAVATGVVGSAELAITLSVLVVLGSGLGLYRARPTLRTSWLAVLTSPLYVSLLNLVTLWAALTYPVARRRRRVGHRQVAEATAGYAPADASALSAPFPDAAAGHGMTDGPDDRGPGDQRPGDPPPQPA